MAPHLVFGAGSFGVAQDGRDGFLYAFDTPEKVSEALDVLERLGIKELDCARGYPANGTPGESEDLLGQAKAAQRGFIIATKVLATTPEGPHLSDELITASVNGTLKSLGTDKVPILYSHWNDPKTSLEEQAKGLNKQFVAGKFERLGLCNYSVEALEKFFAICEENNYIKPTIYQDHYNALHRVAEDKLFPLLRKHNCAFYAYSPLAGGFLTGKVTAARTDLSNTAAASLERTRWTVNSIPGVWYGQLYDKPAMHDAIRRLKAVGERQSPPVSPQEAAMRWLAHHAPLREGDGIVFGVTKIAQIESNVADTRRGPLDGELLEVVEGMWDSVRG